MGDGAGEGESEGDGVGAGDAGADYLKVFCRVRGGGRRVGPLLSFMMGGWSRRNGEFLGRDGTTGMVIDDGAH